MTSAFCHKCHKYVPYAIIGYSMTITIHDTPFTYIEKCAVCKKCGADIYLPSVNDQNVEERLRAYHQAALAKEKPGF